MSFNVGNLRVNYTKMYVHISTSAHSSQRLNDLIAIFLTYILIFIKFTLFFEWSCSAILSMYTHDYKRPTKTWKAIALILHGGYVMESVSDMYLV